MNPDPFDFFNTSSEQEYLPFGHLLRIENAPQPDNSQDSHQAEHLNVSHQSNDIQLNRSDSHRSQEISNNSHLNEEYEDNIVIDFGDKARGKTCKEILDSHEKYYNWFRWLKFDYEKVGSGKIDSIKKVRQYFSHRLPNWNDIKPFNEVINKTEESKQSLIRRSSSSDDDLVVDFGDKVRGKSCKEILDSHEDYHTWFRWLKFDYDKVASVKKDNIKKVRQYFSQKLPYWDEIKSSNMDKESNIDRSNKSSLHKDPDFDGDNDENLVINFGDKVRGKTCKEILENHEDYYTWFRWLKFDYEKVSPSRLSVAQRAHKYFSQRLDYWDDITPIDGADELPARSDKAYDQDDNIKVTKGKAVYGMTLKQILENHEQCEN